MNEDQSWQEILLKYQKEDSIVQIKNRTIIINALQNMLRNNPTIEDFRIYWSNLVLFPEMFYLLWKGKNYE